METTIFEKIIKKEIPATIVYQDEWVTAFEDINPQAPVHILVVPNEPLATTNELTEKQDLAMGKVVRSLASEDGINYQLQQTRQARGFSYPFKLAVTHSFLQADFGRFSSDREQLWQEFLF